MGKDDDSVSRHERKRSKKRKKEKKRRRHRHQESASEDESVLSYDDRRRHRKDRKKSKKKKERKRRRREERSQDTDKYSRDISPPPQFERNFALADALQKLLEKHMALSSDLPIMLIRLAGGTKFDLSEMSDKSASTGLESVFDCLSPFGVDKDANGRYYWKEASSSSGKNDLVLIRVVSTMLDQIGITMKAVHEYEESSSRSKEVPECKEQISKPPPGTYSKTEIIARELLDKFGGDGLGQELAGLCAMILEGESIALDSLPNEDLRRGLESLLVECGLEKSEMEQDSDDTSSDHQDAETSFGFALPDSNDEEARLNLSLVLNVCKGKRSKMEAVSGNNRRKVSGPMMQPDAYGNSVEPDASSDSDDEGPAPLGAKQKGPSLPPEVVKARSERRSRQLESVKQGKSAMHEQYNDGGGMVREEWMLVPGKFDFLSNIKSGQPIRSRGFENKSKTGQDTDAGRPKIDPKVQAEVDEIMRAHEEARGPSLMELHRQKKAEEAATNGGEKGKSWGWNREKDLDQGRRVDKKALNMIFGGAKTDLKEKFHGGFG